MLCKLIGLCFLIVPVIGSASEAADLWCLQCTWDTTKSFVQGNGTLNATGDVLCSTVDFSDIVNYPPNPRSPRVNPMCTYEEEDYERLLKGPCYDYACYALSRKCIKWTITAGGKVLNITRLCASTGSDNGCFTQTLESDYEWEVCVCDDNQFCNGGWSMRQYHGWTFLVLCIGLVIGKWNNFNT